MMTIRTAAEARALGTVLGVWAHPDDETYLSSGLMALARRAGNRVVCVTATRGEHGTDDPRNWPPARLARTRTYELAAAMTVLGVDEHRWLDFEDGTLARLDLAHGAAMVTDLLAEIRPDTVVTFGPDGMTGHPDHRAVAEWVRRACLDDTRAPGPPRLLQATVTAAFAAEFADIHTAVSVFGEGPPPCVADEEIVVEIRLDDELADLKLAALRTQATQVKPLIDAVGVDRFRQWWQVERFRSAAPTR